MLIRSSAAATAARLAFAAFAIVALSASAEAANITFVATNGNDANPCTVITAPCKTLQRAYTVTPINGTINVLTSLESTLTINKNITVIGDGVAIVGSIVIGTSSTSAVVTLRGLALNGAKIYNNGIRIDAAAAVHIEDCTIERYTNGIRLFASTPTKLFVFDTVSRDNADGGLSVYDANAQVTVEDSRFENNAGAGLFLQAARANVIGSVASGNSYGIYLDGGTGNVTETTATDNSLYGFYFGSSAAATLASSVARGNATGLYLQSGTVSVSITDSVITSNTVAIQNNGTLYTRQNNALGGSVGGNAAIPFAAF